MGSELTGGGVRWCLARGRRRASGTGRIPIPEWQEPGLAALAWQIRIGRRVSSETLVLVQDQDAYCDPTPAPGPERPDDGHVGPASDEDIFPEPGFAVAAASAESAVQKRFDNPRLPADGLPAIAVAPPAIILDVEDGAPRMTPTRSGLYPPR